MARNEVIDGGELHRMHGRDAFVASRTWFGATLPLENGLAGACDLAGPRSQLCGATAVSTWGATKRDGDDAAQAAVRGLRGARGGAA